MAGENRALTHDEIPVIYAASGRRAKRRETALSLPVYRADARWHRVFSFGRNAHSLQLATSLIAFTFAQAGRYGRRADRRITTLGGAIDGPDDRHFLMANGVYSTRSHLATVTFCGPNWPTG